VKQVGYWKDSGTLFGHALAVTCNNKIAESNYGVWEMQQGRVAHALAHFYKAVKIDPEHDQAWNNIGFLELQRRNIPQARSAMLNALKQAPSYSLYLANYGLVMQAEGNVSKAEELYRQALDTNPSSEVARRYLGELLYASNRIDDGMEQFQAVLRYWPDKAYAYKSLAFGYIKKGNNRQAVVCLEKSLRLEPADAEAYLRLGEIRSSEGDIGGALRLYQAGFVKASDYPPLLNAMAWIMATSPSHPLRDVEKARVIAAKAATLTRFQDPDILDTYAAALAANGQFGEAVTYQQQAVSLARKAGRPVDEHIKHLELYRGNRAVTVQPYH
ncbi:MAG: tetratricopeptide repeat protein, partial [Armatimonadota bacterium]